MFKFDLSATPIQHLILSGLLLGISNLHACLWILTLVGLVPFLYALSNKALARISLLKQFLFGWLYGFIYIGITIVWFWETYPLTWLTSNPSYALLLIFLAWLIVTGGLSLAFGFLLPIVIYLTNRFKWGFLTIPLVWVIFEYLRLWLYAVVTYAPESLWGPHFSVGMLGYNLAQHSILLQIASWGGVYGLSLLVVVINLIFYLVLKCDRSKHHKLAVIFGGIIFLVSTSLIKFPPASQGDTNVVLVTTYFEREGEWVGTSDEEKYNTVEELLLSETEKLKQTDLIIFPENTHFIERAHYRRSPVVERLNDQVLVIDSKTDWLDKGQAGYSLAYQYTGDGKIIPFYEKQFLVPLGEYTPNIFTSIFNLAGVGNNYELRRAQNVFYERGSLSRLAELDDFKVKALFCSEILSPSFYQEDKEADVLVNLSSHAFFHGSKILYHQVMNVAKVQAATARKPFLQATNGAPSFAIDRYGTKVAESEREKNSVLKVEITSE